MSFSDFLPTALHHQVSIKMRRKYWRQAGVIFIHVPKAAGTSINNKLYNRFMGHFTAQEVSRTVPELWRDLPSFSVTRNPWDRCASAYRFAVAGRGTGGELFAAIHNPAQYRIPEFRNFESFVRDWLAAKDLATLDFVFQPQWRFVCNDEKKIMVNMLGKTEELPQVEAFISDIAGKKITFDKINQTQDAGDYRKYYSKETAGIVERLYKTDISLFDYSF